MAKLDYYYSNRHELNIQSGNLRCTISAINCQGSTCVFWQTILLFFSSELCAINSVEVRGGGGSRPNWLALRATVIITGGHDGKQKNNKHIEMLFSILDEIGTGSTCLCVPPLLLIYLPSNVQEVAKKLTKQQQETCWGGSAVVQQVGAKESRPEFEKKKREITSTRNEWEKMNNQKATHYYTKSWKKKRTAELEWWRNRTGRNRPI